MITPAQRAEIRRLYYGEHWKLGTIAAQLGLHRETVRAAVEHESGSVRGGVCRPTTLDPYLPFIRDTLVQYPRLRATRIHEMVRQRGYPGSVIQVRRLVRRLRPESTRTVYRRVVTQVGCQDGAAGHRPADAAGAGVAAAARHPGPVAGADQAVAVRGAAVDRETDSSAGARRSSMRFTCCRCWSASIGPVAEATALLDWRLAPVWQRARAELAKHTRKPDQEWVRMLRLMETHPAPAVERAVTAASSAIRRAWRRCGSFSGSSRPARRRGARRSRACVPSWRGWPPRFVEPPHLAADLKTLCLSTIAAQWRLLAEQATRQRQAPADYLAQLVHLEVTGRRERRIGPIRPAIGHGTSRPPHFAHLPPDRVNGSNRSSCSGAKSKKRGRCIPSVPPASKSTTSARQSDATTPSTTSR